MAKFSTVDDYINQYPQQLKERLTELRVMIKAKAPDASEKITWSMPSYHLNEYPIHFCCHKRHIGLYVELQAIEHFSTDLQQGNYFSLRKECSFPITKNCPKS